MSRAAVTYPTKDELRAMSVAKLNQHISWLNLRLSIYKSGPVHKSVLKHLQVAEKVREIQRGNEAAGEA
jgi:hypothetical protein